MKRYLSSWIILALLLPYAALHAFVPAGFMVSFSAGMPQLVFCPAQGAINPAKNAHAHHHQEENHEHDKGDSGECPFALAAGASPSTVLPVVVAVPSRSAATAFELLLLRPSSSFFRAHPIRGPPFLS
jgi:hypothetical protein